MTDAEIKQLENENVQQKRIIETLTLRIDELQTANKQLMTALADTKKS